MIELERHIEILLLSNDCVIVPDFGGFMAHHVDARYDGRDSMFLPPLRTIGFNPQLKINDSLLAQSYVEAYDISYPEALRRIADDVIEIRQSLENNGKFELNDIGVLYLNEDGAYTFEPCEAGILTPDFYGLGGVNLLPLAATEVSAPISSAEEEKNLQKNKGAIPLIETQQDAQVIDINETADSEEEEKAEFILIKKSWIRNVAAVCIALIVFFAVSQPLGSPRLQKSQIDTGMLTRIMPKEMVKATPNRVNLNASKEISQDKATPKMPESTELQISKEYYSIVLASRVTKRNAAEYAEKLQAKGFKDTRVLITDSNVKVVYGNYDSEQEAYAALNRLHGKEAFADGWITKVKE